MTEPEIDLARMAQSMGAEGIGPIRRGQDLGAALEQGIAAVRAGRTCVIDISVVPGYDANMSGQSAPQSAVRRA
jgi:TPP-dependent trihydroxycyclohexane-1,2-dione (THcHDO) dehydratase